MTNTKIAFTFLVIFLPIDYVHCHDLHSELTPEKIVAKANLSLTPDEYVKGISGDFVDETQNTTVGDIIQTTKGLIDQIYTSDFDLEFHSSLSMQLVYWFGTSPQENLSALDTEWTFDVDTNQSTDHNDLYLIRKQTITRLLDKLNNVNNTSDQNPLNQNAIIKLKALSYLNQLSWIINHFNGEYFPHLNYQTTKSLNWSKFATLIFTNSNQLNNTAENESWKNLQQEFRLSSSSLKPEDELHSNNLIHGEINKIFDFILNHELNEVNHVLQNPFSLKSNSVQGKTRIDASRLNALNKLKAQLAEYENNLPNIDRELQATELLEDGILRFLSYQLPSNFSSINIIKNINQLNFDPSGQISLENFIRLDFKSFSETKQFPANQETPIMLYLIWNENQAKLQSSTNWNDLLTNCNAIANCNSVKYFLNPFDTHFFHLQNQAEKSFYLNLLQDAKEGSHGDVVQALVKNRESFQQKIAELNEKDVLTTEEEVDYDIIFDKLEEANQKWYEFSNPKLEVHLKSINLFDLSAEKDKFFELVNSSTDPQIQQYFKIIPDREMHFTQSVFNLPANFDFIRQLDQLQDEIEKFLDVDRSNIVDSKDLELIEELQSWVTVKKKKK